MVPASLLRVILPNWPGLITGFGYLLYGVVMVLTYRLTYVALKKSHAYAAVFFVALVMGSLVLMILLQSALGIIPPDPTIAG
jgi:hypothetical protein